MLGKFEIPNLKLAILLSVSLCLCGTLHADEGWSLTTSDFKRQTVNLRSLDDSGAKVIVYGQTEPLTISLDRLLQLDRGSAFAQTRGNYTLFLTSGDRVGGDPLAIANDQVS